MTTDNDKAFAFVRWILWAQHLLKKYFSPFHSSTCTSDHPLHTLTLGAYNYIYIFMFVFIRGRRRMADNKLRWLHFIHIHVRFGRTRRCGKREPDTHPKLPCSVRWDPWMCVCVCVVAHRHTFNSAYKFNFVVGVNSKCCLPTLCTFQLPGTTASSSNSSRSDSLATHTHTYVRLCNWQQRHRFLCERREIRPKK